MRSIGTIFFALLALLAFAACSDQEFTVNLDQPLRVIAMEPHGEATGVRIDGALRVVFSEAVKPGSVNGTTVYLEAGDGAPIEAALTYDAATFTATLQPAAPLAWSTRHRLVVTTGIERVREPKASLPQRVESNFTTAHPPAFHLVGTMPAAGTSTAPIDTSIVATFSEAVDPATVDAASFLVEDAETGAAIAGTLAVDGAVITFVPADTLGYSREIRLTLRPALASTRATPEGGHLEQPLTLAFGTIDPAPLAVTAATPGAGADDFDPDGSFTILFSEPIDRASATAATVLFEDVTDPAWRIIIPGALSFDEGDARITFRPDAPLGLSRRIRATLAGSPDPAFPSLRSARATDDGGFLPATVSWEVKTIDPPQLRILSSIPGAGSVGAPVDGAVAITFSEPIVDFTADPAGHVLIEDVSDPATPASVDGMWTIDGTGTTITFSPFDPFAWATTYRVTLTERIRSRRATDEGGFLPGGAEWTFTTEPPPALSLVGHVPSAASFDVARLTAAGTPQPVVLTFSEAVDPTTVADNLVVSDHAGNAVAGSVTADGASVTFEPAIPFAYSAQVRVTVLPAIASSRGRQMENGFSFVFDTRDPPPLGVTATIPSGGATGVERTAPIVLTFTEGVDQALLATALEVFDVETGVPVAGTLDFGGVADEDPSNLDLIGADVTAPFRPNPPDAAWPDVRWPYSRRFGVRIAPTLGSDRATDGSANPSGHLGGWLEGGHEIAFRVIDPPALLVGDRIPAGGAAQVARAQPLVLSFSEGVDQSSIVLWDGANDAIATLRVIDTDTSLPIAGTLSWNAADPAVDAAGRGADTQLTFVPAGGTWGWSQDVEVRLSPSIRSDRATSYEGQDHGGLTDPTLVWRFHVEDPPELLVVATDPGAWAINVSQDARIAVTFNEVLDPATVTATSFAVEEITGGVPAPIAGGFSFDGGGATAIFTPTADLPLGTRIRVTLGTGICSAIATSDRGCLARQLSWHFDVRPVPHLQVVSTTPADAAQLVPLTTGVTITFNLDVLQASIDPAINPGVISIEDVTDPASPRAVDIALVSYDAPSQTAFYDVSDPLGPQTGQLAELTPYRVRLRGGATGVITGAGGDMLADYLFDFSTGTNNMLFGTQPAASAADVDAGVAVCAIFNGGVVESSIDATSFTLTFVDEFDRTIAIPAASYTFDRVDPLTFALVDPAPAPGTANRVCFVPDVGRYECFTDLRTLLYGETYTATLAPTIQTDAGPLAGGYSWSFTVGAPPLVEAAFAENDVVQVARLDEAVEVPIDARFSVRFAGAMNPATIHDASLVLRALPGGAIVPAAVTLAADGRTAVIEPQALLGYAIRYELRAHGGLGGPVDLFGNYLESDAAWRFETSPATRLLVHTPQGGSNAINSLVAAELSRPIHPPSLSPATLFVSTNGVVVPGLTSPRDDYRVVAFIPSVELLGGSTHTIHVTTGLRDFRGNPMPTPASLPAGGFAGDAFTASFSTSNGNDPSNPSLSGTTPGNGGVLAGGDRPIELRFSEAMNMASFVAAADAAISSVHLSDNLGNRVPATFHGLSASSVEMRPAQLLRSGRTWTVRLDREISDAARNALSPTTFTFTVEAAAPAVGGVVPANGATGVAGEAVVRATFSEAMDPATLTAATVGLDCAGTPVAGVVAVAADARSVTFDPASALGAGAACSFRIDGATDAAGNALPAFASTFAVVAEPVASTLEPVAGGTLPAGAPPAASFARAIDPATLVPSTATAQGTIRLVEATSGADVFGCLEIDPADPRRVLFRALDALTAGASYELIVTAGVQDVAGNPALPMSSIFTVAP